MIDNDTLTENTDETAGRPEPERRFYGKYRGVVASNIDPLNKGRLLVQVQDVLEDDPCMWAMPALPVCGMQMGIFALPPIDGGVWVEYEQGDPNYPVWVGCWPANVSEIPAPALLTPRPLDTFVLQTTGQNSVMISDLPGPAGGFIIKSRLGASIMINDTGIILSNGKGAMITMTGAVITINQGALIIK